MNKRRMPYRKDLYGIRLLYGFIGLLERIMYDIIRLRRLWRYCPVSG